MRPRETSAATTAAAAAVVAVAAAAAAGSTSQQKGLTESLTVLGELARSGPPRKSSQDSGAVLPSDDEDIMTASHRTASNTSSNNSSQPSRATPVDRAYDRAVAEDAQQSITAAEAAAAAWRAGFLQRPRMALAVLAVTLQHIAAHSNLPHLNSRVQAPTDEVV